MKKTLLTLSAVAVVLLIGELFLRRTSTRVVRDTGATSKAMWTQSDPEFFIRYSDRGRRLVPNVKVKILNHLSTHRDVDMRINSLGFRGPEIAIPKPPSSIRFLFLGDSITWGDALPEEEGFVSLTESFLRKKLKTMKIECINAGVGDIGTEEELDILKDTGLKTEPDWVVLCFYLNDSRPPWGFPQELGHAGWLRRHSALVSFLNSRIRLWQWVRKTGQNRFKWIDLWDKTPWKTDPKALIFMAKVARYDWGAAWEYHSWETINTQLQQLYTLAQKHQFRVLVVNFPVVFQVSSDYIEDFPQRAMAGLAIDYGFVSLDLLPILRKHRDKNIFVDHCHYTPEGNQIVAEAISGFIEQNHLIGMSPPSN